MRIVFFAAGGEFSRIVFEAVAEQVMAVVVPKARGRGVRRFVREQRIRFARRDFARAVRGRGLPLLPWGDAIEAQLAAIAPDLIVVAAFPYVVRDSVIRTARQGAINVHPSLLPRHRGSDPVFWTYVHDERESGVTLHWVDRGLDTGDLVAQERVPVERGLPARELTQRLARAGGALLGRTLPAIANGTAPRTPQDGGAATCEPPPSASPLDLDFDSWPAERVWHLLRGIGTHRLRDGEGAAVLAGPAVTYREEAHGEPPGTARLNGATIRLYCRDGWVELQRPSLRRRLGRLLRRR